MLLHCCLYAPITASFMRSTLASRIQARLSPCGNWRCCLGDNLLSLQRVAGIGAYYFQVEIDHDKWARVNTFSTGYIFEKIHFSGSFQFTNTYLYLVDNFYISFSLSAYFCHDFFPWYIKKTSMAVNDINAILLSQFLF